MKESKHKLKPCKKLDKKGTRKLKKITPLIFLLVQNSNVVDFLFPKRKIKISMDAKCSKGRKFRNHSKTLLELQLCQMNVIPLVNP